MVMGAVGLTRMSQNSAKLQCSIDCNGEEPEPCGKSGDPLQFDEDILKLETGK
jgi:hypothetical protein